MGPCTNASKGQSPNSDVTGQMICLFDILLHSLLTFINAISFILPSKGMRILISHTLTILDINITLFFLGQLKMKSVFLNIGTIFIADIILLHYILNAMIYTPENRLYFHHIYFSISFFGEDIYILYVSSYYFHFPRTRQLNNYHLFKGFSFSYL